jgi:hypothetical protein
MRYAAAYAQRFAAWRTSVVNDRWCDLCNRWDSQGYGSLTRQEKTWINIRALIDAIQNGGAISYFYNPGADTWIDCLEDLRTLEADSVRIQVERVASLFPGRVPDEVEARNAIIGLWPDGEVDALLEEVDDELMPLMPSLEEKLARYVERNGLAT